MGTLIQDIVPLLLFDDDFPQAPVVQIPPATVTFFERTFGKTFLENKMATTPWKMWPHACAVTPRVRADTKQLTVW